MIDRLANKFNVSMKLSNRKLKKKNKKYDEWKLWKVNRVITANDIIQNKNRLKWREMKLKEHRIISKKWN